MFAEQVEKLAAFTLMSSDELFPNKSFLSDHSGRMVPPNGERLSWYGNRLPGIFGDGSVDQNEASVKKI